MLRFLDLLSNTWTQVPRSSDDVWPPSRALIQRSLTKSSSDTFILVSGISDDGYDDDVELYRRQVPQGVFKENDSFPAIIKTIVDIESGDTAAPRETQLQGNSQDWSI